MYDIGTLEGKQRTLAQNVNRCGSGADADDTAVPDDTAIGAVGRLPSGRPGICPRCLTVVVQAGVPNGRSPASVQTAGDGSMHQRPTTLTPVSSRIARVSSAHSQESALGRYRIGTARKTSFPAATSTDFPRLAGSVPRPPVPLTRRVRDSRRPLSRLPDGPHPLREPGLSTGLWLASAERQGSASNLWNGRW